MTRRRIVLELGETTTETHCGDCNKCSPYGVGYSCEAYGVDLLFDDTVGDTRRYADCRAAELRPETVEALLYARKCLSALAHANDRAAAAHAALADFERLFGGET